MKPIAIFRFSPIEGPGYFSDFLNKHEIPWHLIKIDEGDSVPKSINSFSGLCLMGGPMSVNDRLSWIPEVLGLVRDAFVRDIPMIGHCLGGQLMSKALGGRVRPNGLKEIGWSKLFPARSSQAEKWFGEFSKAPFSVFQWHGETFDIPLKAELIATNSYCRNQIVSFGPHLAMQCHVEMTSEMISSWCEQWESEQCKISTTVQGPLEIISRAAQGLPELHQLADTIYGHWIKQVLERSS
jgi:GMP synthase-like glutamine amidotransferase